MISKSVAGSLFNLERSLEVRSSRSKKAFQPFVRRSRVHLRISRLFRRASRCSSRACERRIRRLIRRQRRVLQRLARRALFRRSKKASLKARLRRRARRAARSARKAAKSAWLAVEAEKVERPEREDPSFVVARTEDFLVGFITLVSNTPV